MDDNLVELDKVDMWLLSLKDRLQFTIKEELPILFSKNDSGEVAPIFFRGFHLGSMRYGDCLLILVDPSVYLSMQLYSHLLNAQVYAMVCGIGFATMIARESFFDARLSNALASSSRCPLLLTKTFSFAYGHSLRSESLTEQENQKVYSKCFNLHGHNANLEVTLRGWADTVTGMHINFVDLKSAVNSVIDRLFDHSNLNDNELFKNAPRTVENTIPLLFSLLKSQLPTLYEIRLSETDTSWATYREEM